MRAVTQGGRRPDDVVVGDVRRPVPGDDEVLIRIEAAAINPFDLSLVLGHDAPTRLDHIPGRDLAGIVESGPPEMVGTKVWATGGELGTRRDGFHAEYTVLPVSGIQPRPDRLTTQEAASVGVAFTTAWYALVDIGCLTPTDRVLVTGGAGAVGSAAIQIARWRRSERIIALVRNDEEATQATQSGATLAVEDLRELGDADEGERPTLCLDTVGGPVLNAAVGVMERRGRLVNIFTGGDGTVLFDLRRFYFANLTLHGLATSILDVRDGARILATIGDGFATGALQPPRIAAVLPLSDASDAYALAAGRPAGKVVLIASGEDR